MQAIGIRYENFMNNYINKVNFTLHYSNNPMPNTPLGPTRVNYTLDAKRDAMMPNSISAICPVTFNRDTHSTTLSLPDHTSMAQLSHNTYYYSPPSTAAADGMYLTSKGNLVLVNMTIAK